MPPSLGFGTWQGQCNSVQLCILATRMSQLNKQQNNHITKMHQTKHQIYRIIENKRTHKNGRDPSALERPLLHPRGTSLGKSPPSTWWLHYPPFARWKHEPEAMAKSHVPTYTIRKHWSNNQLYMENSQNGGTPIAGWFVIITIHNEPSENTMTLVCCQGGWGT